jgi:hypothetical protein
VHKVKAVSQSKSGNVWIYNTFYTGYTWSPLTDSTTLPTLAAHSPTVLHWLHLQPTHLQYYTGYTWSPLTYSTTLATLGAHSPGFVPRSLIDEWALGGGCGVDWWEGGGGVRVDVWW